MQKKNWVFALTAFGIFFMMLALTGAAMAVSPPSWVLTVLKNVDAWAPTFALVILFRYLRPGEKFWDFIRAQFRGRTSILGFLGSLGLLMGITGLGLGLLWAVFQIPPAQWVWAAPAALPLMVLVNLTAGPLGEELAWRGYLLTDFQRRMNPLQAGLLVGVIWGFWHTPLWLLSGFSGLALLQYIVAFLLAIISFSVVITWFYNRGKNLLIAIWIHFWFNFIIQLQTENLLPWLSALALAYFAAVVLLVLIRKKDFQKAPQ